MGVLPRGANSLENITWSDLGKQNTQAKGLFLRGGGTPHMKGVGMLVVSLREGPLEK